MLPCEIAVHDILKVRVLLRKTQRTSLCELAGVKSLTPTALAHKYLWEVKTVLPQENNTPDDSLAMVTYAI